MEAFFVWTHPLAPLYENREGERSIKEIAPHSIQRTLPYLFLYHFGYIIFFLSQKVNKVNTARGG